MFENYHWFLLPIITTPFHCEKTVFKDVCMEKIIVWNFSNYSWFIFHGYYNFKVFKILLDLSKYLFLQIKKILCSVRWHYKPNRIIWKAWLIIFYSSMIQITRETCNPISNQVKKNSKVKFHLIIFWIEEKVIAWFERGVEQKKHWIFLLQINWSCAWQCLETWIGHMKGDYLLIMNFSKFTI